LTRQHSDNVELATAMYLTFFARGPSPDELREASEHLSLSSDRPAAAVDLAWAMLNSLEFLFNH